MTARRRLLLLFPGLLLALALGLTVVSQSGPVRRHVLRWSEALLTDALGREVRVEAVELSPWRGRLALIQLRVARDRRLAEGVLFSAEAVQARWSWTGLLRRHIILQEIRLVRPRLAPRADGTPGLATPNPLPVLLQPRAVPVGRWTLRVRQAAVQDGAAAWIEADGTSGSLEGLEGELSWGEAGDGVTTGSIRAARLRLTRGKTTREFDGIHLQIVGRLEALSVTTAEFSVAGLQVKAYGRITDPVAAPQLDLTLGVQGSLSTVLSALGSARPLPGALALDGRLQGPWESPAFRGEAVVTLGRDARTVSPLRFGLHWRSGLLEAEILPGPAKKGGSLQGTLALVTATGRYRVRASVVNADLAALGGLPGAVMAVVGVEVPPEVRGELTGEVDLSGRLADLTALRGRAQLTVKGLALAGETPTGHLEARVSATPSRLDVEAFRLQAPGGDLQGRGRLSFATGRLDFPFRAGIRDAAAIGRGFGVPFLGGRVTLEGRLVGTREVPRLQGRVSWREGRVAAFSFDLVEGDIEATSRTIRTPRLILRTGRTTAALRGSVVASGATPLRKLHPKRDLTVDLQGQVNPGRTADLIALIPSDLEIQGTFRASGRLTGTLQSLTGEVELTLENVRTWEESWQRGEALVRFREGAAEITRIALRRGAEQLTGEIGIAADGALRGRLTSTAMDLAGVGSLSKSHLTGRGSFRLDLQGTLNQTRTLGQATMSGLRYRDIPLGAGTATFKIESKAVDLDLTFRDGTQRFRATIGPPPDRRLKAELSLREADLDVVFGAAEIEALRSWQARGTGRVLVQGPVDAPTSGTGEADFESLRLRTGSDLWESLGPVRLSWNGPMITLRQARLRSGEREFEIQGTLGKGNQTDLRVTGQLPLMALGGFLPVVRPTEGLAIANLRLRGPETARDLQGRLEIQRGRLTLDGVPGEFREVQATLDLQGNRIQIQPWQARLAEGSFRASGEIRHRGERWSLRMNFQETRGRVEQLLDGLYKGKGEVTGTFSLGGNLTSEGEKAADFRRNLNGELTLYMRDGRMGRYTVMAKILSLLNVMQLLEIRSPDLSAEGMPYESLSAEIKIEGGIARTDNLVLNSPAMKVNAVGKVNLAEETVDFTVAVKPLQTVDRIVTSIPLAGWILGGKEQSLLVAYFQVNGPLGDPQVKPIPLQSVNRNLFGIFRHLLEIPEALTGPYEDLPRQPVKPEEGKDR
jgi:uncharacterized protein involved in outer membrane biogenesis